MKTLGNLGIILLVLIICYTNTTAQSSMVAKIGPVFSNITVGGIQDKIIPDKDIYVGFSAGVDYLVPMFDQWAFVPGIYYAQKGFNLQQGINADVFNIPMEFNLRARTKVSYVEIPALLRYNFGGESVKAYVAAGPYADFALDAEIRTIATVIVDFNVAKTNLNLNNDKYNRLGIGAKVGAGIELPFGPGAIALEANYQHRFTDFLKDPLLDVRIRPYSLGLQIGYTIPLN